MQILSLTLLLHSPGALINFNYGNLLDTVNHGKLQSGNSVVLGFRVTDVDFKDKLTNGELFVYDARMTGLTVGFTWD